MPAADPARIAARVAEVRAGIAAACSRSGRDAAAVTLIAVTKSQGPEALPALRSAGVRDFGENRIDHLQSMLSHAEPGDRWHYIGRIQGRQLPQIAPVATALHSLCDPGHIDRLARICVERGLRLPVYLQVNTSGEAAKAGLPPDEAVEAAGRIRACPGLDLVGLMTMAPELGEVADAGAVRACFAAVRALAGRTGVQGLSMGMSGDYQIAVEEGATVVRVGSHLFA